MTATLESLGIDRMTIQERLSLIQQIWDSIPADVDMPLNEAQRAELDRRLEEDDKNPDDVVPWEQVLAEAAARRAR